MASDAQTQKKDYSTTQEPALSVFDVKELYDLAYAEKAKGAEAGFKTLLAEAVKLDMLYRRQLAKMASYKDLTKIKKFETATKSSRVA